MKILNLSINNGANKPLYLSNNPLSLDNDDKLHTTVKIFYQNARDKSLSKLKVKFINKIDYFSQRCTDDLLQSELAVKIQEQI